MKYIDSVPKETLRDRYVLVRAGLDLPLDAHGGVADLYRVKRAAATLAYLASSGAKVIVLSHIGRDPKATNAPVAAALKTLLPITYVSELTGAVAYAARTTMRAGDVLLLENLRHDPGEEANDEGFAKALAALGEIYVNDAFSVAHRAHASIVGVPKLLPHYGGLLMRDEIEHLTQARAPQQPSLAILGGAKFETKAPLIESLLERYDHVFIAGALANDVFKARGLKVGVSLISEEPPREALLAHPKFLAPIDITIETKEKQARVKKPDAVERYERIVDIGPDSLTLLAPLIREAKSILWNGPTGLYEHGYTHWTHAIAEHIVKSDAEAVIGGGDTVASLEALNLNDRKNIFLSTGGGAMLEYLLKGTLPGIEALEE